MQRNDRPVNKARQSKPRGPSTPKPAAAPKESAARRRQPRGASTEAAVAEVSGNGQAPVSRVPRLLQRYRDEVAPTLVQEFGYGSPMQVPRLKKIVLNVGMGEALTNSNAADRVTQMLGTIGGQHPVITKARRSIAAFKLREGMSIGAMVTLRSRRMYDFLDRFVNAALPRIRDFTGVPRSSFDGGGNYSLGIREQVIFPEIEYNQIDKVRGLQVSFVTSARSKEEAFRLLELLGMPFARIENTQSRG